MCFYFFALGDDIKVMLNNFKEWNFIVYGLYVPTSKFIPLETFLGFNEGFKSFMALLNFEFWVILLSKFYLGFRILLSRCPLCTQITLNILYTYD